MKNNLNRDNELASYACKNSEALKFFEETDEDIRPAFFRDADRILYSLAYTRYINKTQVFSNLTNDNVTRRSTHVQMVSKIGRTIGRALGLNEDLIEAAALGHDLGHVPFGHAGEKILNEISLANNEGYFNHNIQSVRYLMRVANKGKGLNISLQVLDAIMCHNGEMELREYKPRKKNKEEFLREYEDCYKRREANIELVPMTLEGCVVRISDIIAYLGRDIEDAYRMGLIRSNDLPKEITDVLGRKNGEIINTFVVDIINNSYGKNYITMSEKVFKALEAMKKFNYENIYNLANTKEQLDHYKEMFTTLFEKYLNDLNDQARDSDIYYLFLNYISEEYMKENTNERKVIDYIAGMTDEFLQLQYKKLVNEVRNRV